MDQNINNSFFEEFKSLDNLCQQIYSTNNGVTSYIDEMKAVSPYRYRYIQNWDNDLKQLIRLRHARNRLAHEEGSWWQEVCSQSDIDWLKDFHERILNQTDPLARLHQTENLRNNNPAIPYTDNPIYNNPVYNSPMYSSPTYSKPTYSNPTYSNPTYSNPTYSKPTYSSPTYSKPTYSKPTYSSPMYSKPTYSNPTYSSPTYSNPTYNSPMYSSPTYSSPADRTLPRKKKKTSLKRRLLQIVSIMLIIIGLILILIGIYFTQYMP